MSDERKLRPSRKKATFDTGPEVDHTPTIEETIVRVRKLRENNNAVQLRKQKTAAIQQKILDLKASIDKMKTTNRGVGSKHPAAKLTPANVRVIRKLLAKGETTSSLAEMYGVSGMVVHRIKHGLAYRDVV